ncbi:unnamed protein product [Dovyalis caffra]|uniref:Uncharacterized protein n=1 Tax=Dovyalis caffra TaxID=77055 RepID=A0AAV1QVU2_9ROSI|nr:unnamed protein product [Dovyalis caffra]
MEHKEVYSFHKMSQIQVKSAEGADMFTQLQYQEVIKRQPLIDRTVATADRTITFVTLS